MVSPFLWSLLHAVLPACLLKSCPLILAVFSYHALMRVTQQLTDRLTNQRSSNNILIQVFYADDGTLDGVSAGKKIVDCATLDAGTMQKFHAAVTEKGGSFLEAPVSGSKGELLITIWPTPRLRASVLSPLHTCLLYFYNSNTFLASLIRS